MPSAQDREAALFALALEKPLTERPALLQAVCGTDIALRQRLEALLAAHDQPDNLVPTQADAARPTIKLDLADAPDEAVGQTLGRYKLLEQIGEGGCGMVYVAEQKEPVRRKVALKVIKLGMDTKQVVARFEAERQALAMMDHPNIAKVLDAGTTEVGRPYFVMELVRGIRITFIRGLVSDQLPSLLQQGNVRGARELIRKADALASSSLSNAPAAELTVRWNLWGALGGQLNDMPAALQQAEAINRLVPRVTDDQLPVPREEIRLGVSGTRLWAAGDQVLAQEQAMKELEGLYAEFMGRTPPAQAFAAHCRLWQAYWYSFAGKTNQAEAAIEEARKLLPRAPAPARLEIWVAIRYAAILESSRPAEAEQFVRETLAKLPSLDSDVRDDMFELRGGYLEMVGELNNVLCRQDRFAEATTMLEEQGRWLKTHGGLPMEQVRLDALRGEILARSGNAREALPILEAVATNPLSTVEDWFRAAKIAAATGDHDSFERLSRICSLRFSSTVEGGQALGVLFALLQQPMDERTLALARGLLDRADDGSIGSHMWLADANAFLTYREHRYEEARVLLDRFLDTLGSRFDTREHLLPAFQAHYIFTRAVLVAELGRTDEARRDFARARAQLKLALGDKPGHDRGSGSTCWVTYVAETRLREAEAVFKAKGIPLPEPDAK